MQLPALSVIAHSAISLSTRIAVARFYSKNVNLWKQLKIIRHFENMTLMQYLEIDFPDIYVNFWKKS